MLKPEPTLHLVCGKVAAGKSTLANCLASAPATALISEDHWLLRMCPGEISFLEDHARCSARLGEVKEDHVQALLGTGQSVVMDFPANTLNRASGCAKYSKALGLPINCTFLPYPIRSARRGFGRETRTASITSGPAKPSSISSQAIMLHGHQRKASTLRLMSIFSTARP
jgi:hypothetical protein